MSVIYFSGSPKRGGGASLLLLEAARAEVPGELWTLDAAGPPSPGGWDGFFRARAAVVSLPLYVDHLPAPLLEALELAAAEAAAIRREDPARPLPRLYAIINNGFFEPEHCLAAAGALKLFCRDSGLEWSGALMAGGGPVMSAAPGMFRRGLFPFGRIRRAVAAFAAKVGELEPAGLTGVSLPMPRRLYLFMANCYWKSLAIRNRVPLKSLRGPVEGPGEPDARDVRGAEGMKE
ncbi:MAG: hypothetical protein LBQ12_02515 [Deltaproteobacteria bacterium]|nr:hypothetical protein [Deltaproteobacteria bacterium]